MEGPREIGAFCGLLSLGGSCGVVFGVADRGENWNAVTLALSCLDESAYEPRVLVDGVAVDSTWADFCAVDAAGPLYTTAALPEGAVQVEVVVNQGTCFNLGVFGYSEP